LNEVVIQVGYGTVKKKDATGAVSQISSKDFNKGQNVTPESLISDRSVNVTGGGSPEQIFVFVEGLHQMLQMSL
jgi:iron complex outermembrane receptor protein